MTKLTRKNLVVDGEKIKELARRRKTSESAAVRQAVDYALVAEEFMAAIRELRELGGIDDVFGKMPDAAASDQESAAATEDGVDDVVGEAAEKSQPNRN